MTVKQVKNFEIPGYLLHRLIDRFDHAIAFALYWLSGGDRAMVIVIRSDGRIVEGDTDWLAYLELERLNPIMEKAKLGSREEDAEEYLAFFRNECYLVPIERWDELERRVITCSNSKKALSTVTEFFKQLKKEAVMVGNE